MPTFRPEAPDDVLISDVEKRIESRQQQVGLVISRSDLALRGLFRLLSSLTETAQFDAPGWIGSSNEANVDHVVVRFEVDPAVLFSGAIQGDAAIPSQPVVVTIVDATPGREYVRDKLGAESRVNAHLKNGPRNLCLVDNNGLGIDPVRRTA